MKAQARTSNAFVTAMVARLELKLVYDGAVHIDSAQQHKLGCLAMGSYPVRAREKFPLIALAVFSVGTWLLLLYYWKTVFFVLVVLIFTIWP